MPYSIALSMGVSYRQLRSSRLITQRDRAKTSLEACRSLLEDLGRHWYSAEAMARLGQKALDQLQSQSQTSHTDPVYPQRDLPESAHQPAHTTDVETQRQEPINFAFQSKRVHGAKRRRCDSPEMAAVSPAVDITVDPSQVPRSNMDASLPGGFADIDTLFGDFLDISLPTHFWDPIFMEATQGQMDDPQS